MLILSAFLALVFMRQGTDLQISIVGGELYNKGAQALLIGLTDKYAQSRRVFKQLAFNLNGRNITSIEAIKPILGNLASQQNFMLRKIEEKLNVTPLRYIFNGIYHSRPTYE